MTIDNTKRSNFAPKTYRISKFYSLIFEAINSVFGKDKTLLLYAILNHPEFITPETKKTIRDLPVLHKNHLMEVMIEEVIKESDSKTLRVFSEVLEHVRIIKCLDILKERLNEDEAFFRDVLAIRIIPKYINFIQTFKEDKFIADALEIIIANYLTKVDDETFSLIEMVYVELIEAELN